MSTLLSEQYSCQSTLFSNLSEQCELSLPQDRLGGDPLRSLLIGSSITGNSSTRRGVLFSGRFDGAFKEKAIRDVAAEVQSRAPFVPVLIVDAKNKEGKGYAELTNDFLTKMEVMVPFVFDNYGQWTGNVYSTFAEVKYCQEEQLRCLPLKLYASKSWPPMPPDTEGGGRKGPAQNGVFFRKDLVYKEFPIHNEEELEKSKTAMADYIIDYYLNFHPDLQSLDERKVQDAKALTPHPRVGDGTFAVGEHVQYYSQSRGCWLAARITKDLGDGKYEIDIRPGQHITAQALKGGVPAAEMPFNVGDAVMYYSKSRGAWVQTKVLRAYGDGYYEVEGRQGERAPQELLKSTKETQSPASQSTKEPASPLSPPSSPLSPSLPKKFAVGQHVLYMVEDKERGAWVANSTVILAAHDDDTFEIEALKGARVLADMLWAPPSPAAAR